ncbi:hypothetical protein Gorai_018293 [Gossypium raimondii]|uniref:Flavin-containing monooxygenase n=1 Tax=Gossypium raimondii TaxID=29730 RepID=A0A7J8PL28_GOSRA|nr:hypothetical protein [Gossypium raimondii]
MLGQDCKCIAIATGLLNSLKIRYLIIYKYNQSAVFLLIITLQSSTIVVLIGNGSSAKDILKEISPLASQVHQAIRGPDSQLKRLENHDNAWQHSMIECARKDGKVVFQDGSIVDADVIIHCTGYF